MFVDVVLYVVLCYFEPRYNVSNKYIISPFPRYVGNSHDFGIDNA